MECGVLCSISHWKQIPGKEAGLIPYMKLKTPSLGFGEIITERAPEQISMECESLNPLAAEFSFQVKESI